MIGHALNAGTDDIGYHGSPVGTGDGGLGPYGVDRRWRIDRCNGRVGLDRDIVEGLIGGCL